MLHSNAKNLHQDYLKSMSKKKIISIDFDLANKNIVSRGLDSDTCFEDYDIILLRPRIVAFKDFFNKENNNLVVKKDLNQDLINYIIHWNKETREAIKHGKTVIVYLTKLEEFYAYTSHNSYEYRKVKYNNYSFIYDFPTVSLKKGNEIKPTKTWREIISSYWKEFGNESNYKVTIEKNSTSVCLTTRSGDGAVGSIIKYKSGGTLLLLPDIKFFEEIETEDEKNKHGSEKVEEFANRFIREISILHKALKNKDKNEPEPEWVKHEKYSLFRENEINSEIKGVEAQIEKLNDQKEELQWQLADAVKFRRLLFATGKDLENVLIDTLKVLGFTAENYRDEKFEFDIIFQYSEDRLIGEVKGKDNKSIDVQDCSQIIRIINDDYARKEINKRAKGVLFGNAYRQKVVEDREETFTNKCVSSAECSSIALVSTVDLFKVVQYLLSNDKDSDFAKECRKAIIDTKGEVILPGIPKPTE